MKDLPTKLRCKTKVRKKERGGDDFMVGVAARER